MTRDFRRPNRNTAIDCPNADTGKDAGLDDEFGVSLACSRECDEPWNTSRERENSQNMSQDPTFGSKEGT